MCVGDAVVRSPSGREVEGRVPEDRRLESWSEGYVDGAVAAAGVGVSGRSTLRRDGGVGD